MSASNSKRVPGSVSPRGARWLAQQPPSAGRKSKTFDTEEAGWEWLKLAYAQQIMLGGDVSQARRTTLADALRTWIDRLVIKETTRAFYRRTMQPTIESPLAATPIGDVRPMLVETLLHERSLGHTRVKVGYRLRTFFAWAVANDLVAKDPWIRSNGERIIEDALLNVGRHATTGQAWTVEEARVALKGLRTSRFRTLIAFMLVTGTRRGEALGLRWGAINGHVAGIGRNHTAAGGFVFTEERPKNKKFRNAYFGPNLAAMLEEICPPAVKYDDFVFISRDSGLPMTPGAVTERVRTLTKRTGLPRIGSTHALRRTFATVLDTDGCPVIVREALLGHSGSKYAVPHDNDMVEWGARADELFLNELAAAPECCVHHRQNGTAL